MTAKPERFTARALNGHSAVGLTIAALAYLICLTGTLAVFTDELKLLEQPRPTAGPLQPGAIDRAAHSVLEQAPDTATLYVLAPFTASGRLTLTSYGASGERNWLADASGAVRPLRTPWTEFVDELHMNLTAPAPWGALVVGLIGVAMVSLILSGVLAHPRIFRDAFRLRLGAATRLREADLHNRMSVWGLPFHLAISLSGAFFGIATLPVLAIAYLQFHGDAGRVYASLSGPEIAADSNPAPMPDLDAVVAQARAELPGSTLYYLGVERPGAAGTRLRVEVTGPGRLPRGDQIFFDAAGNQIGRVGYVTGSPGLQLYSGAAMVHFGFWGGLPVRIAYGVLGAALTWITASGVAIWLARRRDRGRPVPSLERAWHGWTRGVPTVLTVAWLFSGVVGVAATFWIGVLLIQVVVQLPWRRQAIIAISR